MKIARALLTLALLLAPHAVLAEDEPAEEHAEEEAAAGTSAAPNEGPGEAARPAKRAYTAPVIRSNSNYRVQQAAPAAVAAPAEDEDEDVRQEEPRPRREIQPVHRERSSSASQETRGTGGGGGSCPAVPKKVRTYRLGSSEPDVSAYCKGRSCASSVQLKHAVYPNVVKVGEIADFMERCDFRPETDCPVPGGYQSAAGLNATSVYSGLPVGGDYNAPMHQKLVPVVTLAPQYSSFDLSIPFEIDARMKGRTFMTNYTMNTSNSTGLQISISACEGDFSRGAIVLVEGNLFSFLTLATGGLEGWARTRADTARTHVALKAGKRYYLNIRRVIKGSILTATDGLPDDAILPYALARQFSRDNLLADEFPRMHFMALHLGDTTALSEAGFTAKPGFRAPGQGL